ncbi:type I-E CRISPR-associated protein Cas6/Cse3/CasE [Streptomyces sp. NBC_00080]|uniref:type I-E CRISPR-associated protein Cas6/Cse3/CasE n=1 Tax=Streptomyces sp. NBC_00080 TaxID=2975645 RepID=UPI00386F6B45
MLEPLIGETTRQRGFRVAHRTADQQVNWLLGRAARHGFTVPAAETLEPAPGIPTDAPLPETPAVTLIARDVLRFQKHFSGLTVPNKAAGRGDG